MLSRPVALSFAVSAVVFFGVGAGTTLALRDAVAPDAAVTSGREAVPALCPEIPAQEMAKATALAELLANTKVAKDLTPGDPSSFRAMYEAARSDPVSRKELFDRYRSAPDGEPKAILRSMLMSFDSKDVAAFFLELAADSDPAQRRDGFELLRITEPKLPEVRDAAMQALTTEQDPAVLSNAIGALHPAIATTSEGVSVVKKLQELARHVDPIVRAQSVRGLAGWDKQGESLPFLNDAMADSAVEVRSAAVLGIIESRARNDVLKQGLLKIVYNAEESPGLRMNAVIALERFALDETEHDLVVQSAIEADQLLRSD